MSPRVGRSVLGRPARQPVFDGGPHAARGAAVRSRGGELPAAPLLGDSGTVTLDQVVDGLRSSGFPESGSVVLGGGCAGLAFAVATSESGGAVAVVEARSSDHDTRTWCYWDTGQALLPEAASHSWARWEVRAAGRAVVATDPGHPYRMVRAHDYRAAARRRLERSGEARLLQGVRVATPGRAERRADSCGPQVYDARGSMPTVPVTAGRVLLHQRFVGQWIRTDRAVFDTSTVTLMDFSDPAPGSEVRFFYVLPVAPDLALVECTVFSSAAHGTEPFRQHIADYVLARWGLAADEWTTEGQEAGSIPMTDSRPETAGPTGVRLGLRAGMARPSTGYAYTRIQIAARQHAAALHDKNAASIGEDRSRVRVLDAIFLRFLRDRPGLAPTVVLRMFERLPGPLTVRFLTERAGLLDDIRLILALPKAPFLRAAAVAAMERLQALRS